MSSHPIFEEHSNGAIRRYPREAGVVMFGSVEAQYRFWGWFYGYPECCVEAFVADVLGAEFPVERRPTHAERGHIMCEGCMSWPRELPPRPADSCPLELLDQMSAFDRLESRHSLAP